MVKQGFLGNLILPGANIWKAYISELVVNHIA